MRLLPVAAIILILLPTAGADYLDDTGYRALVAELGAAVPDGSGVAVSQVEAGLPEYLPQAGSGTYAGNGSFFSGKNFTARSGTSGTSGHAFDVASHFYSLNITPAFGRASMTPGISAVDLFSATNWTGSGGLEPGSSLAPLIETRAVQNHSWISVASAGSASNDNDTLRRLDFAVRRDGFLPVAGVNNGSETLVPSLMASAFNNLSVGLTSGNHSRGGVPSFLDGPGRQKPELVAPLDFTSFSTALVSSAAALLRQTAAGQGPNASRPETLKAILLAGATKDEFPNWSRTTTAPLDPVFGAGELHIANSWRILTGLEQAAAQSIARPRAAWSRVTLTTSNVADYLIQVPLGSVGETFSAVAVWNRVITNSGSGGQFAMTVNPLANYQMELARMPVTGSPVVLDQSLATSGNVEHLFQRQLRPGTYRLRLSLVNGSNVPAAVAWQMQIVPHRPGLTLTRAGGQDQLVLAGLLAGQTYQIQSSTSLAAWGTVQTFTATLDGFTTAFPTTEERRFYRLAVVE